MLKYLINKERNVKNLGIQNGGLSILSISKFSSSKNAVTNYRFFNNKEKS